MEMEFRRLVICMLTCLHTVSAAETAGCTAAQLLQHQTKLARPVSFPPIGFVKTHKTGSSTVATVLFRLGQPRNLSFMLPSDGVHLGWPEDFPGEDNVMLWGPPSHQFDVIANHAVFNSGAFASYLKPGAAFVSVLREPARQTVSCYNYDRKEYAFRKEYAGLALNSSELLDAYKAHYSQAHDFGWRQTPGYSSSFDNDTEKVQAWIQALDQEFQAPGLVLILEHLDEGLTLLAHWLQLPVLDVAYARHKDSNTDDTIAHYELPSDEVLEQLRVALPVDVQLYDHFNRSFWQKWESENERGVGLEEKLAELKQRNSELEAACNEPVIPLESCPGEMLLDVPELTQKQLEQQWPDFGLEHILDMAMNE